VVYFPFFKVPQDDQQGTDLSHNECLVDLIGDGPAYSIPSNLGLGLGLDSRTGRGPNLSVFALHT